MTVEDFVTKLCLHCGLAEEDFSVSIEETEEEVIATLDLPESDSGLFIGYHGETLESIQRLTRIALYEDLGEKRLRVNVNGYREKRQEQLQEKVTSIAQRVLDTGESFTFNYLPAHDRFIIHSTLGDNEEFAGLESVSTGEGRDRVLTIQVKTD